MCNVTFQTLILLMNTIVTKAKIKKNQNVDISSMYSPTQYNKAIVFPTHETLAVISAFVQ